MASTASAEPRCASSLALPSAPASSLLRDSNLRRQIRRDDASVKIRIGYGFGTRTKLNDERFAEAVDALEELRFDSLWLSERLGGEAPDPIVGMAYAAGRTTKLKFGTSVLVLPGRNPVVLAKELATLDRLSAGRLLPAFGLGVADPHEQQAFGVARQERAAWFDEALPLIRRLWLEDVVDHDGPRFHVRGLAGAAQAGAAAPRRVARRHRPFRAAARRAPRRRLAAVVHRARRGGDRAQGDRGGGGRARAEHRPGALRRADRLRHERASAGVPRARWPSAGPTSTRPSSSRSGCRRWPAASPPSSTPARRSSSCCRSTNRPAASSSPTWPTWPTPCSRCRRDRRAVRARRGPADPDGLRARPLGPACPPRRPHRRAAGPGDRRRRRRTGSTSRSPGSRSSCCARCRSSRWCSRPRWSGRAARCSWSRRRCATPDRARSWPVPAPCASGRRRCRCRRTRCSPWIRRRPGPSAPGGEVSRFADDYIAFHNHGVEHRFAAGTWLDAGPVTVWIRLQVPVVAGEEPSPLQRVAAAADFGNGVSRVLPWETHTFINPDLTIHLLRPSGRAVGVPRRALAARHRRRRRRRERPVRRTRADRPFGPERHRRSPRLTPGPRGLNFRVAKGEVMVPPSLTWPSLR